MSAGDAQARATPDCWARLYARGKWGSQHSSYLRGTDVVILPDNDQAGRKHLDTAAASLKNTGADVRVLDLPRLGPKGDLIDWAKAGGTAEQLHNVIASNAPMGAAVWSR